MHESYPPTHLHEKTLWLRGDRRRAVARLAPRFFFAIRCTDNRNNIDLAGRVCEFQFVAIYILVYAHDLSAGDKNERARLIVKELWEREAGCLRVQVLQEFFVTTTLKIARPMDPETAGRII